MVSTYLGYQLITRDIDKSIQRIEKQPLTQRETKYFVENIGKVKSIDAFIEDSRLFNYAMKAFGLEDMAYAKAFMRKALEGGVADEDSFANRLADKRYAEFVQAFNFAALGENATSYNPAQHQVTEFYLDRAIKEGVSSRVIQQETAYYLENIGNVRSIDDLMKDDRLYEYALRAYFIEDRINDTEFMNKVLEGGGRNPASFASKQSNPAFAAFARAFDFATLGEEATTYVAVRETTVEKYLRQTLEEDAGAQNEGVRLALYFERKASSITSPYQILGDQALATVVRTALGLPQEMANADVDKQAALISKRLDIEDLQDPQKVGKFLQKFTTLWEINNPSTPAASLATVLFAQPVEFGVSTDVLLTLQKMKS